MSLDAAREPNGVGGGWEEVTMTPETVGQTGRAVSVKPSQCVAVLAATHDAIAMQERWTTDTHFVGERYAWPRRAGLWVDQLHTRRVSLAHEPCASMHKTH